MPRHLEGPVLKLVCAALMGVIWPLQSQAKAHMLFVTPENCKQIRGYSKNDLQGVAQQVKVPVTSVRYLRSEWGRGPGGGPQCNMVFSTPKGLQSCAVFNIIKDDFVFGQVVPVKGNSALCR